LIRASACWPSHDLAITRQPQGPALSRNVPQSSSVQPQLGAACSATTMALNMGSSSGFIQPSARRFGMDPPEAMLASLSGPIPPWEWLERGGSTTAIHRAAAAWRPVNQLSAEPIESGAADRLPSSMDHGGWISFASENGNGFFMTASVRRTSPSPATGPTWLLRSSRGSTGRLYWN